MPLKKPVAPERWRMSVAPMLDWADEKEKSQSNQ